MLTLEQEFKQGVSKLNRGKPAQSLTYFKRCLKIDPHFISPYVNIAAALVYLKKYGLAEKYLRKALKTEPKNETVLFNLGLTLNATYKVRQALAVFTKLVGVSPKNDSAFNELGVTQNSLGHTQKAVNAFVRALGINDKNTLALYNLGRTLSLAGKTREALPLLKKAFDLNPKDSKSASFLFSISRSNFDWKNARKYSSILNKLTNKELVEGVKTGESPWVNITRVADAKLNQKVARSWSDNI